jgi:hypothetical protein
MKSGRDHKLAIKRQLYRRRRLWGVKLGPANLGRRLDAAERQAIEQKIRALEEGRVVSSRATRIAVSRGGG